MNQRVLTITLNPSYDLMGFCPSIELGDVNLIAMKGLYAAGKGINVAKVLSDLNVNVTVSGFLGEENSSDFAQLFSERGWKNAFSLVEGRTRINIKLTEQSGDVTDLNFSGFSISATQWQAFTKKTATLATQVDLISVNGSLPAGISPEDFSDWLSNLSALGVRVVLDSSREALTAGLKANPWLIKPNEKELSMWAGRSFSNLDDILETARELIHQGISNVVVSLGSKGAVWVTKTETWFAKAPTRSVVSTVGAGDSMVAGLIYGTLREMPIPKTLQFASALASLSVSQTNVGVPNRHTLGDIIETIHLTTIT